MGFEPLPFDPRSACFCHQNCPSFKKPTSRWWTVWSNPPPTIPELGTGVLVEFDVFVPSFSLCRFQAVVLPVNVSLYFLNIQAIAPIPGPTIERRVFAVTTLGIGVAGIELDNEECDIPLNLPGVPPEDQFGGCNIFPVQWWQNANDVPH